MATVSDIVIYRDEGTEQSDMLKLAKRFAIAQSTWRVRNTVPEQELSPFNTFVVSSPFKDFEASHPELVAINSQGETKDSVVDFFQLERTEMCKMSHATEIAKNVWLGPTPDSSLCPSAGDQNNEPLFDILVEASDLAQAPETRTLARIGELSLSAPQHLDFPSSGSIMPFKATASGTLDPVTEMCQWIHRLTNPCLLADTSENEPDSDGDIPMKSMSARSRKILIHCTDGYTETSLLGLAYFMYAERIPVHEAWLRLHCEKKRNFFAYPSDVALLSSLQSRILELSCAESNGILGAVQAEPAWLKRMDGSLPSRILPYMYLGNIGHANNLDLLQAMGIKRILSIGEPVNWTTKSQKDKWGLRNVLSIDRVQDNGIDPLMNLFDRCLEFIGKVSPHFRKERRLIDKTCSTSCFVRARRLNVIIQPHLRFAYELLKWEEVLQKRRGEPVRREMEWTAIAREIAAMNKPYTR
ncbi:MAG: hypothetical protein LQ351_002584 [Letrouitia transgressa]|nr:MAG: hypothetical protein LQ351_002584 [Letrouitia transgressa]